MKNLVLVADFLSLILYLGTSFLLFLYNLARPARSRVYLILAFLLIAGSFSFFLVESFSSLVLIPLIKEYLFAMGLIFFTTVVVEILFSSFQISLYYLLGSLGLTSMFTLFSLATLDLKLPNYSQHWSFPVWLAVQIVILGVLSYFLMRSAIRTKKKGSIVYVCVFLLLLSERFIEGIELYTLKEFWSTFFLIEKALHLLAALLMFTYAAYGLIKISSPEKK